jgi:hypothetical protein
MLKQVRSTIPHTELTSQHIFRVLMTHAQKLEVEAKSMRMKIKELEATLANAQDKSSKPLEGTSLLASKSPQDYGLSHSVQPDYRGVEEMSTERAFSRLVSRAKQSTTAYLPGLK